MSTLAALMVIVACHPENVSCLEQPFLVASYADTASCQASLPAEMMEAKNVVEVAYGDCVPVDPNLLAGRMIYRSIDPRLLARLDDPAPETGDVMAQAFQDDAP